MRPAVTEVHLCCLQGRGYHPNAPHESAPLPGEGSRDWANWKGFSTEPSASPAGGRLATLCHDVLSLGTMLPEVRSLLLERKLSRAEQLPGCQTQCLLRHGAETPPHGQRTMRD